MDLRKFAPMALLFPLYACDQKPPSPPSTSTPTPLPSVTPPGTPVPIKEVTISCQVVSNNGRIETCTIRVPAKRVYQLKYSYYAERENHGKEATIRVEGAAGPASELPGLRPCGASVKLNIDDATLAHVNCALEMDPDRAYAFRAGVVTENGKNGQPKPGLEVK